MNVMRFVGKTSREAMRKLRDTLGPDALVLANRACAEGVELLAAAPDALGAFDAAPVRAEPARAPSPRAPRTVPAEREPRVDPGHEAGESMPAGMSTVSFQDYVRQRLRERNRSQAGEPPAVEPGGLAATNGQGASLRAAQAATRPAAQPPAAAPAAWPTAGSPDDARAALRRAMPAPHAAAAAALSDRPPAEPARPASARPAPASVPHASAARAVGHAPHGFLDAAPEPYARIAEPQAPVRRAMDESFAAAPVSAAFAPGASSAASAGHDALVAELQSLKSMMSRQFATMSWFESVRRSPVQGRMLRTMVASGFSLKLARSVVSKLPSDFGERDAQVWMEDVLARNLRCAPPAEAFESGGVFALVGPTGVGKTTTTAKIAARHVLAHGAQSVALITVDTYRLGAHDQLRAFGRILGVPVHIAHDASALHDLLRLRSSRQLVLVDTVGMGHRDERIRSLLMSLPRTDIRHVVVASCAAQAESIDESLRAYEARQAAGVILTKVDEAARLGGALDCLLRQRLRLLGVCDGQRVPEDWHSAEPAKLVRRALVAQPAGAFALDEEELPLVFGVAATLQGDVAHA